MYDSTANISKLRQSFTKDVSLTKSLENLTELRIKYLGKKGLVSRLLSKIGSLPSEERQSYGSVVNDVKNEFLSTIEGLRVSLEQAALDQRLSSEHIDVTLPSRGLGIGCIHPLSKVISDIRRILEGLGFALTQGPEIEDDWHNFTALNIPDLHPARQMHDTFYIADANREYNSNSVDILSDAIQYSKNSAGKICSDGSADGNRGANSDSISNPNKLAISPNIQKGFFDTRGKLLRTHTSNVQIRHMSEVQPPHKIYSIGKVYRSDYDATHTPMFHQAEGLLVDVDITLGNLKWCLETFLCEFFEIEDAPIRFRPSYFPFTEPSYEVDVRCDRSKKGEIRIGEGKDWLEILGCGMVNINVLKNVGINTDKFQGFAFGIGVERLSMLKYGISDLRSFFHGDVRWLEHYGFNSI